MLAVKFDNCGLAEYSALCWIAAARCEHEIKNIPMELEFLLKSANAFVAADQKIKELFPNSKLNEHKSEALRCYNDALSIIADDSALKAGIVRAIKSIQPDAEATSNFSSPSHRIFDLVKSANQKIRHEEFMAALEKLTEICDNISERKVERFYKDLMNNVEISSLLLLLLLELPPARLSPFHIRVLDKYSMDDNERIADQSSRILTRKTLLYLQSLVGSHLKSDIIQVREAILTNLPHLGDEQRFLLQKLEQKIK